MKTEPVTQGKKVPSRSFPVKGEASTLQTARVHSAMSMESWDRQLSRFFWIRCACARVPRAGAAGGGGTAREDRVTPKNGHRKWEGRMKTSWPWGER